MEPVVGRMNRFTNQRRKKIPVSSAHDVLLSILKRLVRAVFFACGRWAPVKGIPVFCYHSVGDGDAPGTLPFEQFQRQMKYLKQRGFRAIHPDFFVRHLRNGLMSKRKYFMLTFDDGYKDNLTTVFPLLRELDFAFVVFLTTEYAGTTAQWVTRDLPKELQVDTRGKGPRISREHIKELRALPFVRRNMSHMLPRTNAQTRAFLTGLPRLASKALLSWNDVKRMSKDGVSFGSHTCHHPFLTDLTEEQIRAEVRDSKSKIEKVTGKKVTLFCYPYAKCSETVKQIVAREGYDAAFAHDQAICRDLRDPYAINRIFVDGSTSFAEFKFFLCRGFNWYTRLRDMLRRK